MNADFISRIQEVTDKLIKYVGLMLEEKILLADDLVEFDAIPYSDDAYFKYWPKTLDNIAGLSPVALLPRRSPALIGNEEVNEGLDFPCHLYLTSTIV